MSYRSYCSRAFSLPDDFNKEHQKKIDSLNDKDSLLSTFDNNRYVQRNRVSIIKLDALECQLFDIKTKIEFKALLHSSNNVVIIASIDTQDDLSFEQIQRVNDNWIPKENILSYKQSKLHIRNILNYGFFSLLSSVCSKDVDFDSFLNLDKPEKHTYLDEDIQEIERIYNFYSIDKTEFFIIPTMYGNTTLFNEKHKDELFNLIDFTNINSTTSIHIQRNFTYLNSSEDDYMKYIYQISFFNLLKHMKNRMGGKISSMLDELNLEETNDYSEFLEESSEIKKEFTINYDEFNNINIWHDSDLLYLSNRLRAQDGLNIANELEENKNKLYEFIELTTELSKGKLQSFMDSISILIGVLGIFAIFDLIQILTQEPYLGIPWYLSFSIIILFLPVLLMVVAKKSNIILRLFNKIL